MYPQSNLYLTGHLVSLRPVTLEDCTDRYLSWLQDEAVNRYLETRWVTQDLASIRAFVRDMQTHKDCYLLAIIDNKTGRHVGNIKLGPVFTGHSCADISYFVGDRSVWGHGYATEAIRLVTVFAFETLKLRRLQAGVYATNVASARVLEKSGFHLDARLHNRLRGPKGFEDHLWYCQFNPAWTVEETGREPPSHDYARGST